MRRLTPQKIREEFNQRHKKFADWGDTSGFGQALENLSLALRDLQDGGLDVRLDISGTAAEQAFALFAPGGLTTPISGILHINNIQYLLALAVRHEGKDCLKLAVSEFDIRFQGVTGTVQNEKLRQTVRSEIYDLKRDPDALVKFQQYVINQSARNQVVADHDVAGSLHHGIPAKKPVLKMPRNK